MTYGFYYYLSMQPKMLEITEFIDFSLISSLLTY